MSRSADSARFIRFLGVGVLNTAVGYALYALLVWIGLPPQPALALSFGLGVLWNYLTHARLVFGQAGYRRIVPYVGAYGLIYGVNAGALQLALGVGLDPLAAQALLVLPMAGLAFLLISIVLTGRVPFTPANDAEGQK